MYCIIFVMLDVTRDPCYSVLEDDEMLEDESGAANENYEPVRAERVLPHHPTLILTPIEHQSSTLVLFIYLVILTIFHDQSVIRYIFE